LPLRRDMYLIACVYLIASVMGDELGGDNWHSLERETMRKVTRTLAIALLLAGSAALTADAQTSRGAGSISSAAQNFTPIEQVACRGSGPYCRPGFTRVCGPYHCWCRRCW
jgi:predicted small secreted protein